MRGRSATALPAATGVPYPLYRYEIMLKKALAETNKIRERCHSGGYLAISSAITSLTFAIASAFGIPALMRGS